MSCVLFCTDNYLDSNVILSQTPSSESSSYPATNLDWKMRRNKVWRTEGYFNVTASNNKIIFNEGSGDLTATIAVNEYTSVTLFLAAVKTAFEDVSANTFTISRTTSKRITISTSGGTLTLKWSNVGSTAYDLLGFSNLADDSGSTSYTADYLRINQYEFLNWDFGIEVNPTTLLMAGPRNIPLKLSPNSVVTLQGNVTDEWSAPLFESVVPYDNEILYLHTDDGFHDFPMRFWRLKIEDQNPLDYIEFGIEYLGGDFQFSTGKVQFPLDLEPIDRSDVAYVQGGQTFIDKLSQGDRISVSVLYADKNDIEDFKQIIEDFGINKRFFIVYDSNKYFSTKENRWAKFVRFESTPKIRLERANQFSITTVCIEEL